MSAKIMVMSETTGKLEVCTICLGIELPSGERIGAACDVDIMRAYNVDIGVARINIRRQASRSYDLGSSGEGCLWKIDRRKRQRRQAKTQGKRMTQTERVKYYRERVALGLPLFD